MRLPSECYQMKNEIQTHLPHLSGPQLTGLVLWVHGTIIAASGCQSSVISVLLTLAAFANSDSLRQYFREWLYDSSDRVRPCKTELDVDFCFGPLLAWIMALWQSDRLLLAIDPTQQRE